MVSVSDNLGFRYCKLRGRIVEKYGSQAEFAKAYGISKNALSRKMQSKTRFSQADIVRCCALLDISLDEIPEFFFR